MNDHPVSARSGAIRFRVWLGSAIVLTALLATLLRAEVSEADRKKRDAFLKAREEMHTIAAPTPNESSSPAGKPKAAKKKHKKKTSAQPEKTPSPKKFEHEEEPTPSAKKKKNLSLEESEPKPSSVPRASAVEEATPARAKQNPTPASVKKVPFNPGEITIQKSGLEDEQGYEPPPPPPPKRGFWARVFGGGGSGPSGNYQFLTRSVIDELRRAPVQRSRWKFIIVHNSGTRQGNARAFDYYHRHVRKMKNGLAYHFVVGNGTSSGNGQIEVGDRWRRQINGGHVHSDYLNNISLGICLVGDFNHDQPTRQQLQATEELIRYLRERCGPADGQPIPVRPHREMNPRQWSTDCPGDAFPYSWFRRF